MLERSDEISVSPTSESMSAKGTHAAVHAKLWRSEISDEGRADSTRTSSKVKGLARTKSSASNKPCMRSVRLHQAFPERRVRSWLAAACKKLDPVARSSSSDFFDCHA